MLKTYSLIVLFMSITIIHPYIHFDGVVSPSHNLVTIVRENVTLPNLLKSTLKSAIVFLDK